MRMLCMNDDTHEDFYVDEKGRRFDSALDLLHYLHDTQSDYEVKLVYLVDLDDCNNEGCTLVETDAFGDVADYFYFDDLDPCKITFSKFTHAFEVLWKVAE